MNKERVEKNMNQMMALKDTLNQQQREAIEYLNGPLLLLAGAGSGKTRVLTYRVVNLILNRKAAPDEILAVTFTNKAAREMEGRIAQILASVTFIVNEPLWVSTFHSFCVRLLRKNIDLMEYSRNFSIYDETDQLKQIKKVMEDLNICTKTYSSKTYRNRINSAKMMALSPENVEKNTKFIMDDQSVKVYRNYEEQMKKAQALDFEDLLLKTYDLFNMYPDLLEKYQNKFKYILVDEYQDTNHLQYLIVKMLSQKHRNLCVVGDEDQSIYSWRGADISNILNFEKDFPEAKIIKLEQNYRSTKHIVQAASTLIKNNTERKDKTLFTHNSQGDLITIRESSNEYDEARWVIQKIHEMISRGKGKFSDYAIFYRTNAQSRVFEDQFRVQKIPYKLLGGVRFYERMEIKDILSYFKLIENNKDDMAFLRVVNTPSRGIGKTTLSQLQEWSYKNKISLYESTQEAINNKFFNSGTLQKLAKFLELIGKFSSLKSQVNLLDLFQEVLEKSEYLMRLQKENSPESESRILNLEELSNVISQFMSESTEPTLMNFLEELALVSDVDSLDQKQEAVVMMTIHVSKGLEFPFVFMVGLEENLFPMLHYGVNDEEEQSSELEEERRLAYVGMTRARENLFLTYSRQRRIWGVERYSEPSRFLTEIPRSHVQSIPQINFRPKSEDSYPFRSSENKNLQKNNKGAFFDSRNRNSSGRFKDGGNGFENDLVDYDFDFNQAPETTTSSFRKGMKVRHPHFGSGDVLSIEGMGEQQKITIIFEDQTIKKFVAKYARIEKITL